MSEPAVKFSFQNAAAFPQLPSRSVMIRWMTRACELPTMMTVRFVDQEEGYELNHSYRHRDYATNVLTFNYTTEPEVTADVAICVPSSSVRQRSRTRSSARISHTCSSMRFCMPTGMIMLRRKRLRSWRLSETELMLSLKFPNPYSDRIGMVHD